VWPVALALVMPRLRARAVPALLTAAACVIAIRVVLWANGSYEASVWSATFGRFDAMFLGAALAYAWRDGRVRAALFSPHAAVAGGIAIVLMLPMDKTALAYGGYTVASLGAVAIIGAVLVNDSRWLSAALENRPIRAIGRISYALYLWQFPVFTVVHDDVRAGTGVKLVLALSVTFAAAIASTLLVERPFLTLKRRFAAARPTTTAEEAGAAPLAQDFAPARAN
jgi:peptidoglycan/LPS O-acetylase OafA/YrhL